MRTPPKRTGITRLSEGTETRETVQTTTPENEDQKGKFCPACEKWDSQMKQASIACHHCMARLKVLLGNK